MTLPRRVAAVLLAALAAASCGIPTDAEPRALDAGAAPFRSLAPAETPQPTGSARALLFLTRDGTLVAVWRQVEQAAPADLLAALVAGPTDRERERGLSTAIPPGIELREGGRRGVLHVELPASEVTSGARTDEVLGLGQLVLTLTRLPGVRGVQLFRDGQSLSVPRGDGSLTSGVLTRSDYSALL